MCNVPSELERALMLFFKIYIANSHGQKMPQEKRENMYHLLDQLLGPFDSWSRFCGCRRLSRAGFPIEARTRQYRKHRHRFGN